MRALSGAVIRDPKLLILDEATSALNTQSEQLIPTSVAAHYERLYLNSGSAPIFSG